jgi:dTDP-glucose 4,6-dehydratase
VDQLADDGRPGSRRDLITFVDDRPGHDFRYAIDPTRAETELGWRPARPFEAALRDTVRWYLEHQDWWQRIRDRARERSTAPAS